MRCCVPSCKNDSRHISKSQGISFHVIPNEPSLRSSWLKALGKESWVPKDRTAVCSDHFLCEDLYETKCGLRKVRAGAVPFILQETTDCYYSEPSGMSVCRICLATDLKLFPMRIYNLEQAYEHLTGILLSEDERLPHKLCAECAQRLVTWNRFRHRTLVANALLMEVIKKQGGLTFHNIKSINRDNNQLISPLSLKTYPPNYHDMHIEFTETDIQTHTPIQEINLDLPIKGESSDNSENELYIDEDVYRNDADKEFKMSDNYAIDDSLPLEKCKTKKNRKRPIEEESKDNSENKLYIDEDMYKNDVSDLNDADKEFKMSDNYSIDDSVPLEKFKTKKNRKRPIEEESKDNSENKLYIDEEMYRNDVSDLNDADKEFKMSDNYSTDDSLPLEKCKTKKNRKRKVEKPVKTVKKPKNTEPKIDRRRKPFLNDDLNETLFTITDLSVDEQIAEIFKRQESSNYKNSVFKCTECFKGFLDEDAYNSHMTRHTDQCGEHECEICKTHFKQSHALRKHITAHHTQRFSCRQCPYVTTHRQTARLHERWHKGTKYSCPHCPEEFLKFTTYMGHIRIKHPSDFVCELCGYSFVSAKGIELHKKLKHRLDSAEIPEDGPFCEQCNVRFVSMEAHRRHLSVSARHTSAEKPKKGRKSKELKDVERRGREMDDDKKKLYPSQMRKAEGPIPCEQCGLQLEDSRAYHGHFRRMHPDKNRTNYPSMKSPCMCEVCGRIFQSYALLKDHTWTHTGERPFKCESCGKSFRMKQRLVAHRRVHSQARASYGCALCGKHFSTHSNRQRHMFIHTGLKPFKCEMCGKGFKHSSEKRAHITYVHLKKPWPKRARGKRRPDPRQGQFPSPTGGHMPNDMDMSTPLWPACDPKMGTWGQ